MKIFKNTKGMVSIFLVIILVPMMTVSALFVDASKVKLARGVAESAGDLTLNTALTNYDTMLKDMYGLFATAQDTDELFSKLEDYYKTCITSSGVSEEDADDYVSQLMSQLGMVSESNDTADILNMELIDFNVEKVSDANLANAALLEKQIIDFMKYRSPINTGLSFLASLESFTTLSKQTELVDKRTEYYEAQADVMEDAKEAWTYINAYNGTDLIKTEQFLSNMSNDFKGYQSSYETAAKTFIKDLYDTQKYDTFTNYSYFIQFERTKIDDETEKEIPIFYTNSDKTQRKDHYGEYTTYSETRLATSSDVETALSNYYDAYNNYKKAESDLLIYNNNTYGLQFLVQTNREDLYETWAKSMVTLYERYSELRHAVTYSGETSAGKSVMTISVRKFGENSAHPYSYYYEKFKDDFDAVVSKFNQKFSSYTITLQGYANNSNTDTTDVANTIKNIYDQIAEYKNTVTTAKDNLDNAVACLQRVYDGVKEGGTLEQKEGEWKVVASDSTLANTGMAKQDLAEIEDLSTYLNPDDVQKLIERLQNISSHLEALENQINSYTFFWEKICEIDSYGSFSNLIIQQVGTDNLMALPLDKTELNNKVNQWVDGKFVIGEAIDVSWDNQSGTQSKLSGTTDRLNFYSYLYTHFNQGEVSNDTTLKESNEENGKQLYDNLKSESGNTASEEASEAEFGNISTSNELCERVGNPSQNAGSASVSSAEVATGEDAVGKTSASLGTMFSSLSSAIVDVGTDLRDKLYVADYALSMFSYDTIEKEYAVNHPDEELNVQSLTLTPMNADNNFAYGREVEYIIYGGTNSGNVLKSYGSIYGIRLGFNLIYAFMDSSIRDSAFAIATPISAATLGVIPVPLIQAAIIIGLACCESALDLVAIREGEKVPLFKTTETWHCSVNGLINQVKNAAGSVIQEGADFVVDEGTRKLGEVLDMTDEELTKYIESGSSELTGYLGDAYDTLITRHANTAIQKLTTLSNNAIEEYAINPSIDMVEYVEEGLDNWLTQEAEGVDTSSDLSYIVKKEAVNIIKNQYIQSVIETLQNAKGSASADIEEVAVMIEGKIVEIRRKIGDTVRYGSDKVMQYKNEMTQQLKDSMEQGAESVKDTLNQKMEGIFGNSSTEKADNTGVSSLLSFAYSDYLRLFLMIGLYTNEENVVLRIADAIQANLSVANGDEEYRLSNSAVYVEMDVTVQAKPTLLALPLFADVAGNPTSNQNWYTIKYEAIKGY